MQGNIYSDIATRTGGDIYVGVVGPVRTGKSTFTATEVLSKRQKGDNYGMSRTGKLEWYAQADAFETVCLGKTADEVIALMVEGGKGSEAVTTAGCTIGIEGFVKAAEKFNY